MRPLLSAFIRCHRDPGLVQQVARLLRPRVDELILIADARMPRAELLVLGATGADRLLRAPWIAPPERTNAWAHAQCRGRWVLRLDGDEIPSAQLVRRLPALVADDRFTHYFFPRAWLWPDLGRRLDERPWWPDHQARLVRNDPALAAFPGELHACAEVIGPARHLEWPLLHLDLALSPQERRREKVLAYEAMRAGPRLLGRPFNEAVYLPETHDEPPRTAQLAAEDAELIGRVLAAAATPDSAPLRVPRPVRARAIELAAQLTRPEPDERSEPVVGPRTRRAPY